jgi:hypothetical protein
MPRWGEGGGIFTSSFGVERTRFDLILPSEHVLQGGNVGRGHINTSESRPAAISKDATCPNVANVDATIFEFFGEKVEPFPVPLQTLPLL